MTQDEQPPSSEGEGSRDNIAEEAVNQEQPGPAEEGAASEARQPEALPTPPESVPYTVSIRGLDDQYLVDLLLSSSGLEKTRNKPPASAYMLRRRTEKDTGHLVDVLRSRAFYDAAIKSDVDTQASPAVVILTVDAGKQYELKTVDVHIAAPPGVAPPAPPAPAEIGLQTGQPALAGDIVDSGDRLLTWYKERGRPFPKVEARKVLVDHEAKEVTVEFSIDTGPAAAFGETTFTGQENVKDEFLRHKIPWKLGDPYNAKQVGELQSNLTKTGLFTLIQVKPAEEVSPDGKLPVHVTLTERKKHTVKTGVFYRTDEGPGGQASWEDRNLFGGGEDLELLARVSSITVAGEARYRKPEFLRQDQSLVASFRVARDETDAYTSENIISSVMVDRELTPKLVAGAGVGLDTASLWESTGASPSTYYFYTSLPVHLDWNNKNDLLNPTAGQTASLQLQPYWDMLNSEFAFLKQQVSGTYYLQALKDPQVVLATRATAGALAGSSTEFIPADKRYYAGGGGSVRGYAYQTAGPLDSDHNPIGGRSLLEVSEEIRYRIDEKFGLVSFLDGGNVYETSYPTIGRKLFWGTGLGFRYFTAIGPVRLDVAFPLEHRAGVDGPVQVYVSIGQAF